VQLRLASIFGLFDFPAIIGKDQPLSDRIFVWHLICGILIGVIVALHIAGALYHWLVKGDSVPQRMVPGPGAILNVFGR
jgi:cytochrome b561